MNYKKSIILIKYWVFPNHSSIKKAPVAQSKTINKIVVLALDSAMVFDEVK